MPFVTISESPLIPKISPVKIYYREWGSGLPLLFLHGGWGYEIYPIDRQTEEFADRFRILAPDRSGYGRSMRTDEIQSDFHQRAAAEMRSFLEALEIEQSVLWGQSDGAVIAAIMGLAQPARYLGLILEAFHYDREKPASRDFFRAMTSDPERFGERVCRTLAAEHGEDYWRKLLEMNGRAWLKIAEESDRPELDFYRGRLSDLTVPTLFIHGSRDPRTEPDELPTIRELLPQVPVNIINGAGHSPHSEPSSVAEFNQLADRFLAKFL